MRILTMTEEELETTLVNGRWFAGFKRRWQRVDGTERYRVVTNYVPAGVR